MRQYISHGNSSVAWEAWSGSTCVWGEARGVWRSSVKHESRDREEEEEWDCSVIRYSCTMTSNSANEKRDDETNSHLNILRLHLVRKHKSPTIISIKDFHAQILKKCQIYIQPPLKIVPHKRTVKSYKPTCDVFFKDVQILSTKNVFKRDGSEVWLFLGN